MGYIDRKTGYCVSLFIIVARVAAVTMYGLLLLSIGKKTRPEMLLKAGRFSVLCD